jgi:predicted TIM-barrel fold metal-dependent hydrolase
VTDAPSTAFADARDGGVIDTFLAMPDTREKQAAKYETIRKLAGDEGTRAMEMPAQYMFKGVPTFDDAEVDDPVQVVLAQMAEHRISTFLAGIHENEHSRRAVREHPQHFVGMLNVDPNEGMGALRTIDAAVEEWGDSLRCVHVWGTGLIPQVPLDDKRMYPIYAKCIEIGRPIIVYAGVPGPRIPMAPQLPILLDEVCWFWPELQIVVRHGADPWTELMVKLMLKYPGLHYSTSAFAPKYYPEDIVRFANSRGADKVMYAGYFPMGLSLERIFSELPHVGLKDDVWPKFLRENAVRVFGLEA